MPEPHQREDERRDLMRAMFQHIAGLEYVDVPWDELPDDAQEALGPYADAALAWFAARQPARDAEAERRGVDALIRYVTMVVGDPKYGGDVEWVRVNLRAAHLREIAALAPAEAPGPSLTRTIGDALRAITAEAQAEAERRWQVLPAGVTDSRDVPHRMEAREHFVAGALWLAGELSPAALGIEVLR